MSLGIAGMGWVTPLGSGTTAVWQRLLNGAESTAETISSDIHPRKYRVFRVPPEATAQAPVHPRLRRSSAISRFAVVAGLAALEEAGLKFDAETAKRTALIFAVSNGGVIYTKRFYHEVVEAGAEAASPLLFPETVFNAPASHLAAILGITGASYTLVGDGAVGLLALKMAEDLMLNPALDRCLVVGAEEADWLLCDAYRRWHLLRDAPPIQPFQEPPRGMLLSEGAGALLLDRSGPIKIETIDAGCNFWRQSEAALCVEKVFAALAPTDEDLVIASANGTFLDRAERAAILRHCPAAVVYAPKAALGEGVGAGSIWQVIAAAQALRIGALPSSAQALESNNVRVRSNGETHFSARRAVVSVCGLNQQVAGLALSL
ncbi:MAG: hypothetical protein H0W04_06635 [Chthoniobacterales bacterium]|nr:hypothetical protein [Chthoniobacterales bacterium]